MRSSRLRLLLFASASDEAVDYLPIAFLPNRLKAKIQLYKRYNADLSRWKALAEGSPVDEHVYPVRLQDLP